MKEKFSCFNCPTKDDHALKDLEDICPTCGDPYSFPLDKFPDDIAGIKIIQPIARGFYGATYLGEISPFGQIKVKKVIKIIPVELYELHNKNFRAECERHLELSQNSSHFVAIDASIYKEKYPVTFKNGKTLQCHVIGLEYIQGKTLKEYLSSSIVIPSRTLAQIAIDLVHILKELRQNKKHHNDLHPGNVMIEELPFAKKRSSELDENIRVVAIDLGSLDQNTKSNDDSNRVGDLHWVAKCLFDLSRKITDNPSYYDEKDWRLAFLLEEKADFLKPSYILQRHITYDDIVTQIKDTYYQHSNPWKEELKLKSFDDSVNAQSLRPWYVPNLFVDQNNTWINSINIKGPQVITGMRGCGKTMLLRALEFHARVTPQNSSEKLNPMEIIERLINQEGYVGLYVSCVKLLDFNFSSNDEKRDIFEPYSKLFIGYCIQALHSIKHLRDINPENVRKDFFIELANTLASIIVNAKEELSSVSSDSDLEIKLKKYLNSLSDGQSDYKVNIHPKIAFPQLAEVIKKSAEVFSKSYVYFLLDDVSTRYLSDRSIITLVSELLFQDEICAFKFTTEAQTLEMVINAPGNTSQAKIGRDYTVFDLGDKVNKIIHENHHEGKEFIEKILMKRANFYPLHPKNASISKILGDKTLISIAENIVSESKASEKKSIYWGLSALTAVCVGDLGDVITLYELMLRTWDRKQLPIQAEVQNSSYLELCNSRLYDLNRRDTTYLEFVKSFADASHHLLLQSAVKRARGETKKLRQYTSIFINITYGDKERQYNKIRSLIDAGIFTLHGGPEASRTNRQGVNPQQQFKLIFRKLYGVSKHIGLSSADRFEISGEALYRWLENPKDGKKILIDNLNPLQVEELDTAIEELELQPEKQKIANPQLDLFNLEIEKNEAKATPNYNFIFQKIPKIIEIQEQEIINTNFVNVIIGLGFEDATLEAAKIISQIPVCNLILISFEEEGKANEIIDIFANKGFDVTQIVSYSDFKDSITSLEGKTLCDVTGLPKSVIFDSIRKAFINNKEVYFSITEPRIEYPLDSEITTVLDKNNDEDSSTLLTEISALIKAEQGPYSLINLLPNYTNISEPRVLFSFAPIKHERLYTLLDERDYEKINIIVPIGPSPKYRLAKLSAEFSLRKFQSAQIHYVTDNSLEEGLKILAKDYYTYFILNNFHFEIALTGTKLQTLSAAIFASVFKISQCWYLKPQTWDKTRFSNGAGITKFYHVFLGNEQN